MVEVFRSTPENAITVTQLNWYLKELLENDPIVSHIYVKGEISNFKLQYSSGHMYFSLKDSDGVVKTVMFRSSASKLKFLPENGMKVIVGGKLSVYGRDGQYQLYADSMIPDGIGSLYLEYEQMKARLQARGLFNEGHKKPIPRFPKRVGVITSPTGAAVRDILNVLGRRYPLAEVLVYPAQVQGEGAHITLINGLTYFNQTDVVDVIIIGRGGGSIEDLWEFNNEKLAVAIYDSLIPVISAVGHETDFTICDFVSDKRAPTPSAAAEIAVPDINEIKNALKSTDHRINSAISAKISALRSKLDLISKGYGFRSLEGAVGSKQMDILRLTERMDRAMLGKHERSRTALISIIGKMEALNPLSVISRGYAVIEKDDQHIVNVNDLDIGETVSVKMRDGSFNATVTSISPCEKE